MKQIFLRMITVALSALWLATATPVLAADLGDGSAIPHINEAGRDGYQAFLYASTHRAFVIAPGGVWSWVSGNTSLESAEAEALAACRQYTQQPCQLYAVNDQVVFDEATWAASWDMHLKADQITNATVGTRRGNRFPNLALTTPDGDAVTVSDLQGKPVFVHFWGSWCPPCQAEFADLQKLHDALAGDDIAFVLIQGREPIAKSRRWAAKRGFNLPLYDSGHKGRADKSFGLSNGTLLDDRRLSAVYPSTFILDANGLVVFHQSGPGENWEQYKKLISHLVPNGTR